MPNCSGTDALYSRQIVFEKIGNEKQEILSKSHAVIVGCGGLGTRTSELLTRAGVGSILIIDKDNVELNNLQRQALFTEQDIGKPKAEIAKERLEQINSTIKAEAINKKLELSNVELLNSDLVLDCTDNLETRFLINDYCAKNKIPWIYAAVIGSGGMVLNVMPRRDYCLRCILKESKDLENCATLGILNSAAAIISAVQVTEALKILTRQPCENALISINLWPLKLTKVKIKKNPNCPTCQGKFEYLKN